MYNFYKLSIFFGCKYCLCEDDDSIINRCRRARDLAEEVEDITWGEALSSCLADGPFDHYKNVTGASLSIRAPEE